MLGFALPTFDLLVWKNESIWMLMEHALFLKSSEPSSFNKCIKAESIMVSNDT